MTCFPMNQFTNVSCKFKTWEQTSMEFTSIVVLPLMDQVHLQKQFNQHIIAWKLEELQDIPCKYSIWEEVSLKDQCHIIWLKFSTKRIINFTKSLQSLEDISLQILVIWLLELLVKGLKTINFAIILTTLSIIVSTSC